MRISLLLLFCASAACAQIRITTASVVPLGTAQEWHAPQFSPDGRSLFLTTSTYNGIWRYDLTTQHLVRLTDEPRSGYGFAVSPDGAQIVYRRSVASGAGRRQELVVTSVSSGTSRAVASGRELSLPSYAGGALTYVMDNAVQLADADRVAGSVTVLGIENTKIALLRDGKKFLLDPLRRGSYVWPTLSPDGKMLAAVDMSRGAFICDPAGRNVIRLGRCNAPSWTRDGSWLVYMDDRDDGHRLISSDLYAVETAGKRKVRLTATADRLEMFPRCSPVDNRIVCSTPDGTVLMYSYEEETR